MNELSLQRLLPLITIFKVKNSVCQNISGRGEKAPKSLGTKPENDYEHNEHMTGQHNSD